jgi:hypothetical protein
MWSCRAAGEPRIPARPRRTGVFLARYFIAAFRMDAPSKPEHGEIARFGPFQRSEGAVEGDSRQRPAVCRHRDCGYSGAFASRRPLSHRQCAPVPAPRNGAQVQAHGAHVRVRSQATRVDPSAPITQTSEFSDSRADANAI